VLAGDAGLSFATAELALNMGFVAGRVRLLRLACLPPPRTRGRLTSQAIMCIPGAQRCELPEHTLP
jgi:hypothetical protein